MSFSSVFGNCFVKWTEKWFYRMTWLDLSKSKMLIHGKRIDILTHLNYILRGLKSKRYVVGGWYDIVNILKSLTNIMTQYKGLSD